MGLFIGAMNSMISKLQAKMGDKRLLLIVEELDKAGQFRLAEEIFIRKLYTLTGIECDIIFTYPVHLLYDPSYAQWRRSCLPPDRRSVRWSLHA